MGTTGHTSGTVTVEGTEKINRLVSGAGDWEHKCEPCDAIFSPVPSTCTYSPRLSGGSLLEFEEHRLKQILRMLVEFSRWWKSKPGHVYLIMEADCAGGWRVNAFRWAKAAVDKGPLPRWSSWRLLATDMDLREPKETLIGVIVDNPSALEVWWAITPTLPLKGWMMLRNILSSAKRKDNIINNVNLLVEKHWQQGWDLEYMGQN